jgi:hypothetical protein
MARRTKDAPGRVTPKGGRVTPKAGSGAGHRSAAVNTRTTTGRYTAPIPDEYRSSPWWVPVLMLAFFGVGVIIILIDYLGVLPDSPSNWYLLGGLAGIILGFVVATRYH